MLITEICSICGPDGSVHTIRSAIAGHVSRAQTGLSLVRQSTWPDLPGSAV